MPRVRKFVVIFLSALLISLPTLGQTTGDNTFNKMEYAGGIATLPGSKDDTASLTVVDTQITLKTVSQKDFSFAPSDVTQLAYSRTQKVCRGCVIGGVLTLGLGGALFGFKKHKDHWIAIALGQQGSLMLRAQKGNYQALLEQLYKVTKKPIAIDPQDAGDIPSGIPTIAAK